MGECGPCSSMDPSGMIAEAPSAIASCTIVHVISPLRIQTPPPESVECVCSRAVASDANPSPGIAAASQPTVSQLQRLVAAHGVGRNDLISASPDRFHCRAREGRVKIAAAVLHAVEP